jgi:hypothetical protein
MPKGVYVRKPQHGQHIAEAQRKKHAERKALAARRLQLFQALNEAPDVRNQ